MSPDDDDEGLRNRMSQHHSNRTAHPIFNPPTMCEQLIEHEGLGLVELFYGNIYVFHVSKFYADLKCEICSQFLRRGVAYINWRIITESGFRRAKTKLGEIL